MSEANPKMAVFSKPLTLSNSCYEIGHTWTPHCTTAAKSVAVSCYYQAFKIYVSLYVVAALLRRKGLKYWKNKLLYEILQSTLFLGTNGCLFISFFCIWRRLTGFFFFYNALVCGIPACALGVQIERKSRKLIGKLYLLNLAYLPALCASYVAILLERKSRRGILAAYTSNVALETVYRMLVSRGLFRPIKHGENEFLPLFYLVLLLHWDDLLKVWLFSALLAIYLYLFRKPGGLSDSSLSILKFFVGTSELSPTSPHAQPRERTRTRSIPSRYIQMPQSAERAWSRLREGPKHRLCRHDHSCAHYVIKGFLKTFGLGYTIQGGLKLLTSLTRAFRQPGLLWQAVTHKDNFNLAAFLGSFSAIFRAVSCVLRWVRDKDEELHGLVAGFLAGASMMWYKSVTITLYMATKLAEILYFKGIQANILPYIKCADVIIYSISTAFIFHGAVFEPHNLRPAYWRFLVTLTETKFAQMNRAILDVYGTNASKLMPNFWPDFDKRFSSLEPPVRLVTS